MGSGAGEKVGRREVQLETQSMGKISFKETDLKDTRERTMKIIPERA